jgi:hypothetical protein
MSTRRITVKQLQRLNACPSQIRKFRKYFGNSVPLTYKNAIKYGDKFNCYWLAYKFFREKEFLEYNEYMSILSRQFVCGKSIFHTYQISKNRDIRYDQFEAISFIRIYNTIKLRDRKEL